jgi:predicted helicase
LFNHIAGPDLDDRITWLVDDLAQVLAQADMEAVLKDFGKRTAKEDPVVHFYETFLREYDPKVREMRGVYYTPEPVVSYIVRSIDHVLKTRFNKPQGLADPSVLILDPAVGTATFLYNVIKHIHEGLIKQGQTGMWNDYVAEKLLTRLFGFELLMAPYAVAHLKLGLLLQETGYQLVEQASSPVHSAGQTGASVPPRLGIYLTNTLEEAIKKSELLFAQYIVEEAEAAAHIKKDLPIMAVLGNPPYSGISANASVRSVEDPKTGKMKKELTWIGKLIEDYKKVDSKPLGEKNPKWLQDDYVKFIRFGQWRIERTGQGVLGFITNHAYLDNPTFRGMRQSLMNTFTDIYILDLHGNAKKREVADFGEIGHRSRSKAATFSVKSATPRLGVWSSARFKSA